MTDISRGKQIGALTLFNALPQNPGRAEISTHLDASGFAILVADLTQNLAQATCGKHMQLFRFRGTDHCKQREHPRE